MKTGRPILTYIRCKCLEWLGHVWRADGDVLKNVLTGKINKNVHWDDQE